MTYPLTTNGHKLLLVEVNENSSEFEIIHNDNDVKSKNLPILIYLRGSGAASQNLFEYGKHFSILGTITNGQIDFDCERLVEFTTELITNIKHYKSYIPNGTGFYYEASNSFLSLLSANGIPVTGKIICLEIKK